MQDQRTGTADAVFDELNQRMSVPRVERRQRCLDAMLTEKFPTLRQRAWQRTDQTN